MGWVLEGFGEAKILDFCCCFEQKSKTKKHDVLEGPKEPSRRRKKLPPGAPGESDNPPRRGFSDPGSLLGGREVQPKNNILII